MGFKTYVAEDEKARVVGHYGLIFAKIKIGNEIVTGSQAVDAVTHPDYQRQGMFVKLGSEILREAGDTGVPITYGFPNEPALPGHRKVKWIEVCNVSILIKPLNIKNILRKYINNNLLLTVSSYVTGILLKGFGKIPKMQLKDISVNQVCSFDKRANGFWSEVADDYEIIQVRDADFLNWRYVENPDKQYTVFVAEKNGKFLGYTVLGEINENGRKGGVIIDILTHLDHGEISHHLVSRAVKYFEERNLDYIACLMRKGNIYYRALKRHGFIITPKRTRFIVHINSDSISQSFTDSLDKWFFTWGDSDYV